MIAAAARRLLGLLLGGLLGALLLGAPLTPMGAAGTAAAAAAAPADDEAVEVLLDGLAPSLPRAGSRLTVSGRVRNGTDEPLADVTVRLHVDSDPLRTRGDVAVVAGDDSLGRRGETVTDVDLDGEVAPGATAGFQLTVEVDTLPLRGFGVYVATIEARARGDAVGRARTFLPWDPRDEPLTPARIAWLWPLVDGPHRLVGDVFADDNLATSLRPRGRLGSLAAVPATVPRVPVTFVVDPMLLDDAAEMAKAAGYRVRRGATTAPGAGGEAAANWLKTLANRGESVPVAALPYGAPDAVALIRRGLRSDLDRATTLGPERARTRLVGEVRGDLAWPLDGRADTATVRALRAGGARAVVLAGSSLPPRDDLPYTPTGRARLDDGTDVLLSDDILSSVAGTVPKGGAALVAARQRWLAETAMLVAERPSGVDGAPRTVLVAPPQRWGASAEWASFLLRSTEAVRWLRPVSVGDLLATEPPDVRRDPLRYPEQARSRELPAGYLADTRKVATEVSRFTSVLSNPRADADAYDLALRRLQSSAWRAARPAHRDAAVRSVRATLAAERDRVRVIPGSVTLGARSGPIPVTIENKLNQPVTVRLELRPQQARLQVRSDVPAITVGPNQREQVQVPAEAVANGVVQVDARLLTPSGAPYSQPVTIRVRVTQYGTVGAYVTIAAAALLFLAAGTRLVRRRRAAARRPAAAPSEPQPPAEPRAPDLPVRQ